MKNNLLIYLTVLFICGMCFYISLNYINLPIFAGPDGTSTYLFSKNFADTGKIWINGSLSEIDKHNMFHFRSSVNYGGKIIPVNSVGATYFYGFLYVLFDKYFILINLFLSLIILLSILIISRRLKLSFALTILCTLGTTPIIYYMGQPLMNILPTIAFFMMSLLALLIFFQTNNKNWLILSTIFGSMTIFLRNEFILIFFFIVLASFYFVLKNKRLINTNKTIILVFIGLFFLTPILFLNYSITEHPLRTGISIFHETYFTERAHSTIIGYFSTTFSGILNPTRLMFNFIKYLILFAPILFLFSLLGYLRLIKEKKKNLALFILIIIFFVLQYQGTANVWGSNTFDGSYKSLEVSLDHSIIRYWLPIYSIGIFLMAFGLKRTPFTRKIFPLLVTTIICLSFLNLFSLSEINNFSQIKNKDNINKSTAQFLDSFDKDAIIFSSRNDKNFAPFFSVATWWNGEEGYDPNKISESMNILYSNGYTNLYLYREEEVVISEIDSILRENYGLYLEQVDSTRFYKITKTKNVSQ